MSTSVASITRACDVCRKKKIRCDPVAETCHQCLKSRSTCHFTPIRVKRGPRRKVGQQKFEEMEKRLHLMEQKLHRVVEQNVSESDNDALGSFEQDYILEAPIVSELNRPSPVWNSPLTQNHQGFQIYSSSQQHLRGPGALPIDDCTFTLSHWKLSPINDLYARKIFQPLPPREKVPELIEKAFQGFNSAFPIFDQEDFMKRLNGPDANLQDTSWWACLNVMLALSLRFQALSSSFKEAEDRDSWGYFQNALSVATELTTLHKSLSAVQALVGMAVIVQGTPNSGPYVSLSAAALKLAQSMNFHRKYQDPTLGQKEIEQRRNVFWILYFIDKEISLTTGNPPVQDDDDMDVEMPTSFPPPHQLTCGSQLKTFFQHRIDLAIIQGEIYKRLCTVKSHKKSQAQRLEITRELEGKLQAWKASVPTRPPFSAAAPQSLEMSFVAPILHCVVLRLAFYNTLTGLYRVVPGSFPESFVPNSVVLARDPTMSPSIIRVQEARNALELLHVTPQGDYACIWVVLHIFVSATTTILHNILLHPSLPAAQSDMKLIKPLLNLLGMLSKSGLNEEVQRMYKECFDLFREADAAMTNSRQELHAWQRHEASRVGKESLEDFLRRIESISAGYEE